MGNKLGRKRQVVDEKYTRPQGLYQHKDVDQKKLRKLIIDSKLAPCYPGDDDCGCDLEECPICFLYYPSLNRSRCCMKGICTECFLQMKTPNSTRPTQCPFCKTLNYAVEYRGGKTKEEKGLEQIEEQRVIEAKIRMRQQELQDDEDRMLKQRETSSLSSMRRPTEAEYCLTVAPTLASALESEETVASHMTSTASAIRLHPCQRQNRDDDFDVDLEDIMVMEAIWLSIQENGRQQEPPYVDAAQSEQFLVDNNQCCLAATAPVAGSSSSPSGGLACAIAALAERQQKSGETSNNHSLDISTYNTTGCSSQEAHESRKDNTRLAITGDDVQWVDSRPEESAEVGTSYENPFEFDVMRPQQDEIQCNFQPVAGSVIPESFEEQMMLAMAVSLAEA